MLVDEFQDLTPAHLLLVRLLSAPGRRGVRRGRRRPDDLRVQRRRSGVVDRLRQRCSPAPAIIRSRSTTAVRPASSRSVDRLLRHNRRRVAQDDPAPLPPRRVGGRSTRRTTQSLRRPQPCKPRSARGAHARPMSRCSPASTHRWRRCSWRSARPASRFPVESGSSSPIEPRCGRCSAWLRLATGGASFRSEDLAEALRRPSRPLHPRVADWVAEQGDVAACDGSPARLNAERDTERVDGVCRRHRATCSGWRAREHRPRALVDALLDDDFGLAGAVQTLDADASRHEPGGAGRRPRRDPAPRRAARRRRDVRAVVARRPRRRPRSPGGVVLATVHRVKGQEWPHVIVHLADDDQYPAPAGRRHRGGAAPAACRDHAGARHATIVTGRRPSPFIAELTTEPPAELPMSCPRTDVASTRASRRRAARAGATTRSSIGRGGGCGRSSCSSIKASEWVVAELDDGAVVATQGRRRGVSRSGHRWSPPGDSAARSRSPAATLAPSRCGRTTSCAAFREGARQGKPAYVVFDDKTLVAIADALPATLADLARSRA